MFVRAGCLFFLLRGGGGGGGGVVTLLIKCQSRINLLHVHSIPLTLGNIQNTSTKSIHQFFNMDLNLSSSL